MSVCSLLAFLLCETAPFSLHEYLVGSGRPYRQLQGLERESPKLM